MIILAIDPGNEQSAWCLYDAGWPMPLAHGKQSNDRVRDLIGDGGPRGLATPSHVVLEMIASYGMPVGREVFETVRWIGRFEETAKRQIFSTDVVYRRDVKLHLCGQARAKDGNVRQALIDRWGGKAAAIGTKASPGPLYGLRADAWQALGVAVTYAETCARSKPIASCEVSSV